MSDVDPLALYPITVWFLPTPHFAPRACTAVVMEGRVLVEEGFDGHFRGAAEVRGDGVPIYLRACGFEFVGAFMDPDSDEGNRELDELDKGADALSRAEALCGRHAHIQAPEDECYRCKAVGTLSDAALYLSRASRAQDAAARIVARYRAVTGVTP